MRPRLKGIAWERVGDELRLVHDPRDQLVLTDPDGTVEKLLGLLGEGGRTVAELADELSLDEADVQGAVAAFDAERLLEDGDRLDRLEPADTERYFSNLAFFESFSCLDRSREDLQRRLRESHVLVLGTGGLNSNTIPHLAGLGVGRMTLLDRDTVDPRNFARQYLYRWDDVGSRKVARAADWVRAFDPSIEVETIDLGVENPEQLDELVGRTGPDVVASGIDRPGEIDLWVNAACVRHGVPFVRGGMWVTSGTVWSVAPGVSACRACVPPNAEPDSDDPDLAAIRLYRNGPRPNRGIGPVAGLLGAFGAFEVLRYLTGFEPPAYAGRPLIIDFAGGCATSRTEWPRNPTCDVCGGR
ncbi:ThiF family adenylyltransferase [Nonomuraea glycinis]|uniref:Thiamine/molybdopterin biosynthesis protein n=1 Tax=Nonomuraea glycinis TaxID=2047744 RepID=A0A918AI36_9ACTN|nr:ThiF family adenylyltransferase [Nonomuraea glycinis]MCA2183253.1 ThiF family adenylyltransferase [Nonomuraea glycinis]GGP18253.1 thiamine/molybdopterin biosynthesis protein [Nonomuraea glycinis]